jgi:hypothetical protein
MAVLQQYLRGIEPEYRGLVRSLDALVRQAAPDLEPSLKWGNMTYSHTHNVCSIIVHARHVNLQVWGGAKIPDPHGLLSGTGSRMRHVKFTAGARFSRRAVASLVRSAAKSARESRA